ncbi:DUF3549 family protein, partial [Streptomyces scabiei]|uniref:DUF3549 family protein n=1 Tax=Streptomyces scabiei TaxID=1930 RepID=UPI0038F7F6CB
HLPLEVLQPLSAMLEHVQIPVNFAQQLLEHAVTAIQHKDTLSLICVLRAMSKAQAHGITAKLVDEILASEIATDSDILLTIAGRCFSQLE